METPNYYHVFASELYYPSCGIGDYQKSYVAETVTQILDDIYSEFHFYEILEVLQQVNGQLIRIAYISSLFDYANEQGFLGAKRQNESGEIGWAINGIFHYGKELDQLGWIVAEQFYPVVAPSTTR